MTLTEENYLKIIFHLEKGNNGEVSTSAIAEEMNTKASSVTDMIQRLADKELVVYTPYRGVTLMETGRKHAISVIRKHRLWECFLLEKLHFSWDEVHEIAEELEHIQSDKLTDRLDEFLDFPKVDPHGDSIPDRHGNFQKVQKQLLSECPEGFEGVFIGVRDSSPAFLRYLDKHEIAIGNDIRVHYREPFDQSVEIGIQANKLVITQKTANNLYLQSTKID